MKFELEGSEYIELNNLLKVMGLCNSGGQANQMISDGLVLVDGKTELRKRRKLRQGMVVELGDVRVTIC